MSPRTARMSHSSLWWHSLRAPAPTSPSWNTGSEQHTHNTLDIASTYKVEKACKEKNENQLSSKNFKVSHPWETAEKFNFDVSVLWYHDWLKSLVRVETGSLSKSLDGVQTLKGSFQPEHSWLRSSLCDSLTLQKSVRPERYTIPRAQLWLVMEPELFCSHALTLSMLRNT